LSSGPTLFRKYRAYRSSSGADSSQPGVRRGDELLHTLLLVKPDGTGTLSIHVEHDRGVVQRAGAFEQYIEQPRRQPATPVRGGNEEPGQERVVRRQLFQRAAADDRSVQLRQ
jgi:hypothetical protein